jgi:hypothetical protein
MSLLTDGNLLPFRQYNESDVINLFSLDATGLNGMLVAIQTGQQDPATSAGQYRSTSPNGVAYTNIGNYGYGTTRKVRPAIATDTKVNVLGVTLHTTAIYDENGNPLVNQPYDRTIERGFVQTGFAVPILTRGIITVKLANIVGTPFPGHAATIGAAGAFGVANPSNTVALGTGLAVVGKYLSYSGSAFGGYAQIKLEL